MKRALFDGSKTLQIVEVDIPQPGPLEVQVKVDSACICGTDIHILDLEQPADLGTCLGHEFSGVVTAVGDGVTVCKVGDLVTIEPHTYCGICKFCRVGKKHLCLNKIAYGVHLHGGFQQYSVVPQHTVFVVPPGTTPEEAALCEPLSCVIHGIDRAQVTSGDTVLIFGGGVIGMMLLKMCRLAGASSVIVSEPAAHRRMALLELGADHVVDPLHEDLAARVLQLTDGLGPDLLIESAGRGETAQSALDLAGRCSRILFFGVVPPGVGVNLSPNDVFKKELTILGSVINPDTHYRAVQLVKQLDMGGMITHRFPLEQINEAMDAARNSTGLKLCIKPNG